jgi:hypothetical protein
LFFLLSAFSGMKAGDGTKQQDGGLWANVCVTPKPINGKWKTAYSIEYRSKENFRTTSLLCGMLNGDYIFNDYIQAGVGYEYFLNREADGKYSPEHRYYPEAILSYRVGALSAALRSRVMNTFTQWNAPHWEGRNRLKITYALKGKKVRPFVAVEPFHEIYPVEHRFKRIRYLAGVSCGKGRQRWDVYYLREDYVSKALVRNILAIDYSYAF